MSWKINWKRLLIEMEPSGYIQKLIIRFNKSEFRKNQFFYIYIFHLERV
jgi:hypothetical protein